MEDVILDKEDAGDWVYRGEGAANLVLAYTDSQIGKVMRILKSPTNKKKGGNCNGSLTPHERRLWGDSEQLVSSPNKETVELHYVMHVLGPLLGPKHVDPGIRVTVTRKFLESVERNVICQRPTWRVEAAQVDVQRDSALLISDHSVFPNEILRREGCMSVEIKPKCGFLPDSIFISQGNSIKRSLTRFRMHQALKLHKHEISELSEYDPLDLFSGCRDRIQKAIKALYATPQNNFRVFLNGSLVFGGLGGGTVGTNLVVGEAFEGALKTFIHADKGLCTKSFLQLIAETVYSSKILDRLLEVQKLDGLDIEGAIHAYYNIIAQPCAICRELKAKGDRLSEQYNSLHSISPNESLKIVKDFLIAATAKDCSLMISFRPGEDADSGSTYNTIRLASTNQVLEYKAYFIDLDLKPLKKMEVYYERDKKIVEYYNEILKSEQSAGIR